MFRWFLIFSLAFIASNFSTQVSGSIAGAFLASRFSASVNDFDKSAMYTVAMIRKGNNQPEVYNDALLFLIAAGKFEDAYVQADQMVRLGIKSPALGLALVIRKIKQKQFDEAIELIERYKGQLPDVLKTSMKGWIFFQKGNWDAVEREFGKFSTSNLNFDLGSYYLAIAYAQRGNYAKSLEIIGKNIETLEPVGKNYELFRANLFDLAEDSVTAKLLLANSIRNSLDRLTLKQLYIKIREGEVTKLNVFKTPNSGIADTLILFAEGGDRESNENLIKIFYCQLAKFVSNDEARFNIRLAKAFAEGKNLEKAIETLESVDKSDLFYPESKLMLAEFLTESFKEKQAVDELKDLMDYGIRNFEVYESLGNAYRHGEEFKLANIAYSEALKSTDKLKFDDKNLWLTYFFRGIAREQMKDYERAMDDLRKALEFVPEQPQVLNYLGYMLIERRENLDEALKMIELAIKKSPQSGYIVDSLAWGLYQLGRYYEAVVPMEKAISLEPEDPIVNDHFGDILWKVGRRREAYFQWKRALLFDPDEELLLRIQEKLKEGLTDSLGD